MDDKKNKLDDWMARISFFESGGTESGLWTTGTKTKEKLALDRIMVVRSEKTEGPKEGDDKTMDTSKQAKPVEKEKGEKLHVMILDDEPIVGKRLQPVLTKAGFEVEVFLNPKEALARLDEKEFDIVVTDLKMEEVDGIQVLENILSRCKKTRVILITGYATIEVAREALVKGAFDFIAKPFKPGDLRAVINKAALSLGHKGVAM